MGMVFAGRGEQLSQPRATRIDQLAVVSRASEV
jgi:hypothetical protein